MKDSLKLLACFLGIIASIILSISAFFVIEGLLALRIIILVLGLGLSLFLFILSSKYRKVVIVKEELEQDIKMKKIDKIKVLCPRCHKPFDGDTCFYCGFRR